MDRRGFFGRLAQIGAGAVAAKVVKDAPEPVIMPEPALEFSWQSFPSTFVLDGESTNLVVFSKQEPQGWVYLSNKPKRKRSAEHETTDGCC